VVSSGRALPRAPNILSQRSLTQLSDTPSNRFGGAFSSLLFFHEVLKGGTQPRRRGALGCSLDSATLIPQVHPASPVKAEIERPVWD
jgi:hypothetical protein